MVGLSQGFPLATQPVVDPETGLLTRSWLNFFQGIWTNASSTSLPDGITLPPGSVDLAAFAPFLNPVGLAPNGLPDPIGYTGPRLVFSSDGNLYRYVNGAWTLSVPAAAIVGQIPLGAIPQIPTTQLTGYVQAAQIQANSIGVDQISAGYIYAGQITASQITAGTLSAGVILGYLITATDISVTNLSDITASIGTLTSGTITGATIQTGSGTGARFVMSPGVFFAGYNASNDQTIVSSPNFLGGYPIFSISNPSGILLASLGGAAPIVGENDGNFSEGGLFSGAASNADAIKCNLGGLTFINGYIAMGGGSITGLGGNLTSTSSTLFLAAGTNITHVANLLPNADNTYTHGNSSFRLSVVYSAGGVVTTSDEEMKTNIEPETLGLDFINSTNPSKFNLNTDAPGAPLRHGLIAQQIETALNGESFAGLYLPEQESEVPEGMGQGCSINGMTPYGLNYSEFIGPMIKAIQELSAQVTALQQAA